MEVAPVLAIRDFHSLRAPTNGGAAPFHVQRRSDQSVTVVAGPHSVHLASSPCARLAPPMRLVGGGSGQGQGGGKVGVYLDVEDSRGYDSEEELLSLGDVFVAEPADPDNGASSSLCPETDLD